MKGDKAPVWGKDRLEFSSNLNDKIKFTVKDCDWNGKTISKTNEIGIN